MIDKKNIMIYPSGAGNALEVYYAIKESVHINVIPATGKEDISELVYQNGVVYLPYIQQKVFIEQLNDSIHRYKIDYIIPTHDTVALYMAENQDKIDCKVITSSAEANRICRYKRETYKLFKDFDFCPEVYSGVISNNKFPVFSKPNVGEGSKGTGLVMDHKEFLRLKNNKIDLIFLEYLPGKEFTIDCFTDRKGVLQFVGPRERVEIQMGVSFRSRPVKDKLQFETIARIINNTTRLRGLWFFQLKEDKKGKLKLLEISTRTPGTIGLFRHLGVNLPLLSVFDAMGMDIEIIENTYDIELFRMTKNRFKYSFDFQNAYIDFDDTLIVNKKVNLDVLSFIYQCKNQKKNVILITRHEMKIHDTLKEYHILESLFDRIIEIGLHQEKSDFINPEAAIFIDNWYQERFKVKERFGIPVFDVDMVNSLVIECL